MGHEQNSGTWGDAPTGSGERGITVVISFGQRFPLALPQHAAGFAKEPATISGDDLWPLQPRHMTNIGLAPHTP